MRYVLGLVLAGLVGLGVWVAFGQEPEGGAPGEPETTASPTPGGDPSPTTAPETKPDAAVRRPVPPPPAENRGRQLADRVAALPAAPPAPEGLEVRVVARDGNRPLPGATVVFLARPGSTIGVRGVGGFWSSWAGMEREIKGKGLRFTTDGRGVARIPWKKGCTAFLLGVHGTLWGMKNIRAGTRGPVRLALEEDRVVRVQVVDGNGTPLRGVPVALVARLPFAVRAFQWGATRGPSGTAVFAGLQKLTDLHARWRKGKFAAAVINAPLLQPVSVRFDLEDLPTAPLRLVLPPTGRMEVRVREMDGPPEDDAVRVSLLTRDQASLIRFGEGLSYNPDFKLHAIHGGRVVFPYVGLGLTFDARAFRTRGGPLPPGIPRGAGVVQPCVGPTRPGETASVTVTFGPRAPILTGRVLDDRKRPLVRRQLWWDLNPTGPSLPLPASDTCLIKTDAQGRFRARLGNRVPGTVTWVLRLVLVTPGATPVACPRTSVELAGGLEKGVRDLGDLVLRSLPLVAAGTVKDDRGEPLSGASILVSTLRKEKPPSWVLNGKATTGWHLRYDLVARTDAEGAFTIRGRIGPPDFRIQAQMQGYLNSPAHTVAIGTRGLKLTLDKGGRLAGSLLDPRPPSLAESGRTSGSRPPIRITVEHREPDILPGYRQISLRPGKGGAFVSGPLPAGRVDLVVALAGVGGGEKGILKRIPGIRIVSRKTVRDPRLQGIDLRGAYHQIRIDLVPPEDFSPPGWGHWRGPAKPPPDTRRPWRPLLAYCLDPEGRRSQHASGPSFVLATTTLPVDVEILCPGCLVKRLAGVSADRRVTLEAQRPLTFRLAKDFRLPDNGIQVRAHLHYLGDRKPIDGHVFLGSAYGNTPVGTRNLLVDFGKGRRERSLPLRRPGAYEVIWQVWMPRKPLGWTAGPVKGPRARVTLTGAPGATTVLLKPHQTKVDVAARELLETIRNRGR